MQNQTTLVIFNNVIVLAFLILTFQYIIQVQLSELVI